MKRAGLALMGELTGDPREASRLTGARYLSRPAVKAYIAELQADVKNRTTLPWDRVVQELERLALSNIGDFLKPLGATETGAPAVDLSGVPHEALSVLQSITHTPTRNGVATKISMHDKLGAITALARINGKFLDNVNLKLTVDDLDKLISAMRAQLGDVGGDVR